MPNPESVNPQAFTVKEVLFNQEDFSICYGTWNDTGNLRMAMRWNDAEDGRGYPKVFAHPQWFIVSELVAQNFLTGLLNNNRLSDEQFNKVLTAIKELNQ